MMRFLERRMLTGRRAWMSLAIFVGLLAASAATAMTVPADEPDPVDGAADYVDSVRAALPPGQAEALADNRVTFAEQEAATAATVACMEAAGVRVDPIPAEGLRPTRIGVRSERNDKPVDEVRAILENCRKQHLDQVNFVWAHSRPPDDTRRRANAFLRDCLADSGLTLATEADANGKSPVAQLLDRVSDGESIAAGACLRQTEVQLGFIG